jgi:hypothetical protein
MVAKKKRNEKDLHQIQMFHLREEAAQKKGGTGRSFPIRVLPLIRFWKSHHRTSDRGTIDVL